MAEPSTALQVRLPPVLHEKLKRLAQREGTSLNHEATAAIRAHIDASNRIGGKAA